MNDPTEEVGFVDKGFRFKVYDPSLKPPCPEIPPTPLELINAGGQTFGPITLQNMLLYLPDVKYWEDRWKRGMAHFEERGLKNIIQIPGFHGVSMGIKGTHFYDRDHPGNGYNIGQGYTAGFLSAYLMYCCANLLPHKHFMFLECDAELIPDFEHHLSRELYNVPEDFDFIWVGSCCSQGKTTKHVKGNVYQFDESTGFPQCSQTLIIAKKALPYIIQTNRDAYASADLSLIFHTLPKLRCFGIIPRLSTQYNNELPI